MTCGVDGRCGVSLRDRNRELRSVHLTTVHCIVDKNFLLTNDVDFNLGPATSATDMWTSTENGCFLEGKLETTQNGGVCAVRADCRMHHDAIAWSITVL